MNMKKTISMISILSGLTLGLMLPGYAQPKRAPLPSSTAKKQPPLRERVQRLEFNNEEVQAGRDIGAGEVVTGRKKSRHKSLIKVRENFVPELIKLAESI